MNQDQLDKLSTASRLNTLEYWLFECNKGRSTPIKLSQIKSTPFYQPQTISQPDPKTIMRLIVNIYEHKKAHFPVHVSLIFMRPDHVFLENKWFCPFCFEHYHARRLLFAHINLAHSVMPFKCICGKFLLQLKKVEKHLAICPRKLVYPILANEWLTLMVNSHVERSHPNAQRAERTDWSQAH